MKTEVFPSEMGEESIPWWVWLVAALLGLLLLTIIVICLKKVTCLVINRGYPIIHRRYIDPYRHNFEKIFPQSCSAGSSSFEGEIMEGDNFQNYGAKLPGE